MARTTKTAAGMTTSTTSSKTMVKSNSRRHGETEGPSFVSAAKPH